MFYKMLKTKRNISHQRRICIWYNCNSSVGNEFDLKPPHYQRWLQRLMCIWSKAIVINGIIHLLYAWAHWGNSTNLCLIKIHIKIYIEIKFSNLDTQKKLELLKHCNKVDCWIMLASFKSTNKFIIIEYELFNDV